MGTDRFSNLKLSMFVKPDDAHDSFPKLSGRAIEIKNMMPALAHVWLELCDLEDVQHQAVLWGLAQSSQMDSIVDMYPDVDKLPAEDANAYRDAAYEYARTQAALADFYNGEGGSALMIFDITAKTHWMLHGADDARYLNPRLSWNYAGEDFMGKVKVLHASCCKGNSAAMSTNKFAEKYCFALHLIFQEFVDGMQ
jgi:hypothetical protein